MSNVEVSITANGQGLFFVKENNELIGEMVFGIDGSDMTVFHTETSPAAQGRGLAKQLLDAMVAYAREHHLKVIALCPYVHAQFARHKEQYADIWKTETE